mmetsp:Transcript_32427/g.87025  ORF Transcript_32427/g.87025 Transcript_32427/m.87025 type:complete len:169 (+) Transcript_32427:256-762(+)
MNSVEVETSLEAEDVKDGRQSNVALVITNYANTSSSEVSSPKDTRCLMAFSTSSGVAVLVSETQPCGQPADPSENMLGFSTAAPTPLSVDTRCKSSEPVCCATGWSKPRLRLLGDKESAICNFFVVLRQVSFLVSLMTDSGGVEKDLHMCPAKNAFITDSTSAQEGAK